MSRRTQVVIGSLLLASISVVGGVDASAGWRRGHRAEQAASGQPNPWSAAAEPNGQDGRRPPPSYLLLAPFLFGSSAAAPQE